MLSGPPPTLTQALTHHEGSHGRHLVCPVQGLSAVAARLEPKDAAGRDPAMKERET